MKRKKKKKNNTLIIFIITTLLIVSGFVIIQYRDEIKILFYKEAIPNKTNPENKKEPEPIDPYEDYKKTSNYKEENLNRYLTYKEKNANLDYETIVTYVNIGLDYEFYSYITDANMIKDNLVLMNKYFKLASDYEPNDLETISSEYFINGNTRVRQLRKEAKEQFELMAQDAIANGTPVYGQSGYRPYSMQQSLYNNAVSSSGKVQADSDTARPGHSEHQTGLAIDISSTKGGNMLSFDRTSSFTWMQDNAHKYGFILRYPNNKSNLTGFMYESWHYRYVGVEIATDMHNNYPNLTYDEYYFKFIDNKN